MLLGSLRGYTTHIHASTHMHTHTHIHMHTHTHPHTCTHPQTYTCTHTHTHAHTYTWDLNMIMCVLPVLDAHMYKVLPACHITRSHCWCKLGDRHCFALMVDVCVTAQYSDSQNNSQGDKLVFNKLLRSLTLMDLIQRKNSHTTHLSDTTLRVQGVSIVCDEVL